MATETADPGASHRRSVTTTSVATLSGALAGVASAQVASGPGDTVAFAVFALAFFAGLAAMRVAGIDVSDFGMKDNLYVLFMTFSMWFITYGILLTEGAL